MPTSALPFRAATKDAADLRGLPVPPVHTFRAAARSRQAVTQHARRSSPYIYIAPTTTHTARLS